MTDRTHFAEAVPAKAYDAFDSPIGSVTNESAGNTSIAAGATQSFSLFHFALTGPPDLAVRVDVTAADATDWSSQGSARRDVLWSDSSSPCPVEGGERRRPCVGVSRHRAWQGVTVRALVPLCYDDGPSEHGSLPAARAA